MCRRRQWHPTPVLLPGKPHGRRSLEGCSPWGRWGSDTTERLYFHFSLSCIGEGNGSPLQYSCCGRKKESEVAESCPTLCESMDCSLPGSSIHGIFPARILEWVAISFSNSCCAAAAAAKSLQSCLTLCDPLDGSPPGSSAPGILQARILEWVAISFSNAWKWKVKVKSLSRAQLLATP